MRMYDGCIIILCCNQDDVNCGFLSEPNCHVLFNILVSSRISILPIVSTWSRTSAPVDPNAPTFHPVTTQVKEVFGQLEPKDTEWLCSSGFVAETQIFYTIGEDGTFLMCQIIHSSVGCVFI
jgi:hypothetical protein